MNIVYRLGDGRLWSVDKAEFVGSAGDAQVVDVLSADGESGVEYLKRILEFYGYPLGELGSGEAA